MVFICLSYLVGNFLCKTGLGKCHSIQFDELWRKFKMGKKCMSRKKIEKDQKPEEGKSMKNEIKIVKVKTSKMSHFE